MREDVRDHGESSSHTNLSVQGGEPESCPVAEATSDKRDGQSVGRIRSFRIPPRRIALSGGGVRALAHVGALKVLESHGYLRCVKEVLGVSAGALFALMISLGYTLDEIEVLSRRFDFTTLRNPDADVLFLFPETFGLDRGEPLERLLASILRHKGFGEDTTCAQLLTATGPRFRCFASNIETAESREFSAEATPGLRVITAVRASMSVPLYYTPVQDPETGQHLMDGGVIDNLPIGHIPFTDDCWCLSFTIPKRTQKKEIPHLLTEIYTSIVNCRYVQHRKLYKGCLIEIPCGDVSPLHFDITPEERDAMILCAADAAKRFLFTTTPVGSRRFSAS